MKDIYTSIVSVIGDNQDSILKDIKDKLENQLLIIEWNEKYDLNLDKYLSIKDRDFVKLNEYYYLSYFKNAREEKEKGYGRFISWSDDGRQPQNEWLLNFSYSTGAYIFGDDYPQAIFQDFWNELKTYNPKYIDSTNHNMYFSLENAGKILNDYNSIYSKYCELNRLDSKNRKILKLQAELEKLNKTS
jgi:hypothetical protein